MPLQAYCSPSTDAAVVSHPILTNPDLPRAVGIFRPWAGPLLLIVASGLGLGDAVAETKEDAAAQATRVVVRQIEPFVFVEPQGYRGFTVDLWQEIAEELRIKTEYSVAPTVAELLKGVRDKAADVAMGAITITAQRETEVDFTHPFYRAGLRIAVPARSGPTWFATLARFASADFLAMLGTLLLLTFVTANLLWFLERRVNPECFPSSYAAGVFEATWWSIATIITGGCENKSPVSVLGRLVAIAWMLGSIVLVASFTATLSSQMTAETVTGAIAGPEGLPGRLVATIKGTSAVGALRARDAQVVECASLEEAFALTESGRADAVVFDAPVLAYKIRQMQRCPVRLVGPLFENQDYGIALPTGSPLREHINQVILRLDESGKLAEINKKWFGARD